MMPIGRKDIAALLRKPLAGYLITIKQHTDPTFVGRSGIIVGDSWGILEIRTENKTWKISKAEGIFTIRTQNGLIQIHGELLVGNQKKRSKRKLRNW